MSADRIPPERAYEHVRRGEARLVCAYPEAKCRTVPLPGAISMTTLRAREEDLSRGAELLLYCD